MKTHIRRALMDAYKAGWFDRDKLRSSDSEDWKEKLEEILEDLMEKMNT